MQATRIGWERSGSTISYVIKNQGTGTAGPSTSQLVIDGAVKATDAVGPLGGGTSSTESFTYSYSCSGTSDSMAVQADKDNVVAEGNEGNNVKTESWTCLVAMPLGPIVVTLIKPDLIITDIWRGGSKIFYKIKNVGALTAGESKTRLRVDGITKAVDNVPEIAAGAEIIQVFSAYSLPPMPFHTFNLHVWADYVDDVTENNETNNTRVETTTYP